MKTSNIAGALLLTAAASVPGSASATDVNVVGLFTNKAVVQINGGAARTLSVGQKIEGVLLVSVERDNAVFDIDGRRKTLRMGQQHVSTDAAGSGKPTTAVLSADLRGHFFANGQINGGTVRMVVDTGATLISIPVADADRLGIDYRKGQQATMNTANGLAPAWRVKLDTVRVGDITMNGVDAVVMEGSAMPVLLGMSFLNRTEMRREGSTMTLTKRF